MIKLVTESEEINKIIFAVNGHFKKEDSKKACNFILSEYNYFVEFLKNPEDYAYYDDMFNIIYKSINKKNKIISYISLSYAILFIMIFIKFSNDPKKFQNKDKDSNYLLRKNILFLYPDCMEGIKIMGDSKYLLIDYKGNISFHNKLFHYKLKNDFDYGKFLTSRDFKVFKFDQSNFQYISNIHLEKFNFNTLEEDIKTIITPKAPYLIISGNLVTFDCMGRLDLFFDFYSNFYDKIIYVLGNYEFHNSNLGIDKTIIFYREYIRKYNWKRRGIGLGSKKILFLEQELIIFNNIHIIGFTLWSKLNSTTSKDANNFIKSKDQVMITGEDIDNIHIKSVIWLVNTLRDINQNLPVLVVSHYIPSFSLIDDKNVKSPFFLESASNLDNIIKSHSNIINWILGHPFSVENEILNQTLFLSSNYENFENEKNDCIVI